MFNRNNVKTAYAYVPSIASGGSLIAPIYMAPAAAQVVGLRLISGAATLSTNANLNLYKNASSASSYIATTGSMGTLASYTGTSLTSTVVTTALSKLAAADVVLFEFVSAGGTTTNYRIEVDYIYGYQT